MKTLVIGTRGSQLATTQTGHVADALRAACGVEVELKIISTRGDRVRDRPLAEVGGKGLFTLELEQALHDGSIDLAVHSLKDLPTDDPEGLVIAALPERVDPRDVLVGSTLDGLAAGAVVGTGSARRRALLLDARPDLALEGIRGNVDTRLRKLREGPYDAIVLAAAGLDRLGLEVDGERLDPRRFVPAPGQGVLAVQCAQRPEVLELVARIDHASTRTRVAAERGFLAALGGGCSVPAAAYAELDGDMIVLHAALGNDEGTAVERVEASAPASRAASLGEAVAAELLGRMNGSR